MASFKEIEFGIDSTQISVTNNYSTNLSKDKNKISVEAFVNGINYKKVRDDFIGALSDESQGTLRLPTGTFKARCKSFSVKDSKEELNVARFSITFEEYSESIFQYREVSISKKIESKISDLTNLAIDEFVNDYQTDMTFSESEFVKNEIDDIFKAIDSITSEIKGFGQEIYLEAFKIKKLQNKIRKAIDSPKKIAENLKSVFESIVKLGRTHFLTTNGLMEIISRKSKTTKNLQTINKYIRFIAISFATGEASKAIEKSFKEDYVIYITSKEEAIKIKKAIILAIEDLISDEVNIEIYRNYRRLKQDINNILSEKINQMPSFHHYDLKAESNALNLTKKYYGNMDGIEYIIQLNKVTNPFIIDNKRIEIIKQ
jgi:hypothetical protein